MCSTLLYYRRSDLSHLCLIKIGFNTIPRCGRLCSSTPSPVLENLSSTIIIDAMPHIVDIVNAAFKVYGLFWIDFYSTRCLILRIEAKKTASNTITVISEVSLSLSHSLVQFLFLPFYLNSTICNTWSSIAQLMRQTSSNYCRSLFHIVKTECYLIKVNAENAVKKNLWTL